MAEISYLNGENVPQGHLNQISFIQPSLTNVDLDSRQTGNQNLGDILMDSSCAQSTSILLAEMTFRSLFGEQMQTQDSVYTSHVFPPRRN